MVFLGSLWRVKERLLHSSGGLSFKILVLDFLGWSYLGGPRSGGMYFWEGVEATGDVIGGLGDTEIGCLDARSVTLEGA